MLTRATVQVIPEEYCSESQSFSGTCGSLPVHFGPLILFEIRISCKNNFKHYSGFSLAFKLWTAKIKKDSNRPIKGLAKIAGIIRSGIDWRRPSGYQQMLWLGNHLKHVDIVYCLFTKYGNKNKQGFCVEFKSRHCYISHHLPSKNFQQKHARP